MKKFSVIICVLLSFLCVFALGCQKNTPFTDNVVELRSDILIGKSENYNVKAKYGYTQINGEKVYALVFKLMDRQADNITYSVSFNYDDKEYKQNFSLDGIKNTLTATFEIDDFNQKQLEIFIHASSNKESVTITSIVPNNAITYEKALEYIEKNQSNLTTAYKDEQGNFNAKIIMRIIVKKDKPYWYVGIYKTENDLKAFLLDGVTGETLAIREIF